MNRLRLIFFHCFLVAVSSLFLYSCANKPDVDEKEKYFMNDKVIVQGLKADLQKVINAEHISFGFSSFGSTFSKKEGVTCTFSQPDLNLENDSLVQVKAELAFERLKKVNAVSQFYDGVSIILEQKDSLMIEPEKLTIATLKFNLN